MKNVMCSAFLLTAFTLHASETTSHIALPQGYPGITGLFAFDPEASQPLTQLAQTILRRKSTLSEGERELIAAYVSRQNQCVFCCNSHSYAAKHLLHCNIDFIASVIDYPQDAAITHKLKALLVIADQVRQSGKAVTEEHIKQAKTLGATDQEIHDTVLISAMFCMFNRYVDGLTAMGSTNQDIYDVMGKEMAEKGYVRQRERMQ